MDHCCSSGSSRIIKEISMGYGSRALRAFFGVGVIVGIIWLVYVGILADHAMTRTTRRIGPLTQTMEHWKLIGKHKYPIHQDLDIHHVSRRRVPSGPDPIHNRRAWKARQSPAFS